MPTAGDDDEENAALDAEIAALFAEAEAELEAAGELDDGDDHDDGGDGGERTTQPPAGALSDATRNAWAKLNGGAATAAPAPGTASKVSPAMQRFGLQVPAKDAKDAKDAKKKP